MQSSKWDKRFIRMADMIASWSKDPSSKIGAVIVDRKKRIVSMGFNGFPMGVVDSPDRYEDRGLKYQMVLHAEENAILSSRGSVENCIIYVTHPVCSHCAAQIIQSGIAIVKTPLAARQTAMAARFKDSNDLSKIMFQESGVEYIELR